MTRTPKRHRLETSSRKWSWRSQQRKPDGRRPAFSMPISTVQGSFSRLSSALCCFDQSTQAPANAAAAPPATSIRAVFETGTLGSEPHRFSIACCARRRFASRTWIDTAKADSPRRSTSTLLRANPACVSRPTISCASSRDAAFAVIVVTSIS